MNKYITKMDGIQEKSITQKLKSEYQMKSSHLVELKEEICTIRKEMHRSLGQESSGECPIRSGVASLVEAVEWRKKLHLVTSQLQNIHLDDGTEHRSLKQLQRHVQLSLMTGPQLDTEVYELVDFVADLNLIHENLCRGKEEIENEINTALRALAKTHLHLHRTAEHDSSTDSDSADYMTHFVKQHVNLRRRKVPLQDLTNQIVSSESSSQSVISDVESPDISTFSGPVSGINANTRKLKIQHSQNTGDSDTRDTINKQIVNPQGLNDVCKEIQPLLGTSNDCKNSNQKYSHHNNQEEYTTTGFVRGHGQGLNQKKSLKDNPDKVIGEFDFRSKVGTGLSIGVECRHHGSSSGKIKLSHFSTPTKPVCSTIRKNPAQDRRQNLVCHHINRIPSCDSPQKPIADDHVPESHTMEPPTKIPPEKQVMDIPYIDDEAS